MTTSDASDDQLRAMTSTDPWSSEKRCHLSGSDDGQFAAILSKCSKFGLNLDQYRDTFLRRRIGLRMKLKQISTYAAYFELLRRDVKEQEALKRMFSVNVTEFFRDKELFITFRDVLLPQLRASALEGKVDPSIRIWCAGCASGEEPYTIAIIMHETLGQSLPFHIYALDRNPVAIERAKLGRYDLQSLNNVGQELLQKYFTRSTAGTASFEVSDEIKRSVIFSVGDMGLYASPVGLDVIFCRNVMIYMSDQMHQRMLNFFHSSLNSSGYLILGQSEMITGHARRLFEPLYPRERIYRKITTMASGPTAHPALS